VRHDDRDTGSSARVRAGRLSALLAELARDPDPEPGSAWEGVLHPGAVIGRFELVREIGRGGFGIVYEARDLELGRAVAFKAVRASDSGGLRKERLLAEAETAARLSHPNLVTLYDVGRSEHGPYLVLELLRGETLAQRLARGALSVEEALRIAADVARGLAHAHALGVVHRDLTPGNVFLCADGQVKLLDLGLAHAFGRSKVDGGTPAYMAPEQRRGAPEDERTDVFALGVILYEALLGERPFRDDGRSRLGRADAPPVHVSGRPALGELVGRMLERDPVKRPRHAGEVLAAITALQLAPVWPAAGARAERGSRPASRRAAAIAAAGVLLVVAAAALVARSQRPATAVQPPSIAVMPFTDLSPRGDEEHFSDGVAEEVLNALAHVEGLRVAGRTSSFFFKGKSVKLADIGRELRVGTVLEGSVRKDENRVRVTVQLLDVANGYHLWSETYDRELTGVFALQDEIARRVVEALKVKLLPGHGPAVSAQRGTDPRAYQEVLEGRHFYNLASPDGYRRAVAAFEAALAIDPAYAPAWAGLAVALNYRWAFSGAATEYEDHRTRAVDAATRAVALGPDLAEAFKARGYVRAILQHDWAAAQEDMERALALNPGDADARSRYAIFVLAPLGRVAEAIQYCLRATELDPLAAQPWNALGLLYSDDGQHERAIVALRRSLELSPQHAFASWNLTRALLAKGRSEEALRVAGGAGDEMARLAAVALAERALGHEARAREALGQLLARDAHRSAYYVAQVYGSWGDREEALAWLERAQDQHDRRLFEIGYDLSFRALRGEPRYLALLGRLNLAPQRR
jgi:TolB-like protein/Tfp pilus assembly protein PilF